MELGDNEMMSASTEAARRRESAAAPGAPGAPGTGTARRPILFVDGCCVLCQRAAAWVARRDRRGRVALAALQGKTARRLLPGALREAAMDGAAGSVVWRAPDGALLLRSAAVLAAVAALGGRYRAAAVLRLVPAPLRDALYGAVARRRRRWFGATRECLLPAATASVVLD
ncbi:MAG: DCC1-like thiol-disulfide oxidoreductase family protein [Spirochaetaceae bacterium]|nr:DCC1-like thiol-disulfide oxidoreductase family protein [Spirochaetaceae bacterium]